jgi:hypothetical protein
MHLLSPLTTKQQHPLKCCAQATLLGKCCADQDVLDVANTGDCYSRQILAARRQKKKSSSKCNNTQESTLRDPKGVTQVRPPLPQEHQNCQAHATNKVIDELANLFSHTQSAFLDSFVQRTSRAQLR